LASLVALPVERAYAQLYAIDEQEDAAKSFSYQRYALPYAKLAWYEQHVEEFPFLNELNLKIEIPQPFRVLFQQDSSARVCRTLLQYGTRAAFDQNKLFNYANKICSKT
jgi:hypothetical protein